MCFFSPCLYLSRVAVFKLEQIKVGILNDEEGLKDDIVNGVATYFQQ